MRINICNKISTGAILRSKKNNLYSGKGEKMKQEKGGKHFGSSLKIEQVGRGGKSWAKSFITWIGVESIGFMNSVLEYH